MWIVDFIPTNAGGIGRSQTINSGLPILLSLWLSPANCSFPASVCFPSSLTARRGSKIHLVRTTCNQRERFKLALAPPNLLGRLSLKFITIYFISSTTLVRFALLFETSITITTIIIHSCKYSCIIIIITPHTHTQYTNTPLSSSYQRTRLAAPILSSRRDSDLVFLFLSALHVRQTQTFWSTPGRSFGDTPFMLQVHCSLSSPP